MKTGKLKILTLTMAVAIIFAGCSKEDDGASALIGKWTSVSATGTVAFSSSQLGVDVAKIINENLATYDLTGIINFEFGKDGVTANSNHPGVFFYEVWKYTLKDKTLSLGSGRGAADEVLEISFNGKDEFTIKSISIYRSSISTLLAYVLCEKEVIKKGYENVEKSGLQITSANNLTIKFQKQ